MIRAFSTRSHAVGETITIPRTLEKTGTGGSFRNAKGSSEAPLVPVLHADDLHHASSALEATQTFIRLSSRRGRRLRLRAWHACISRIVHQRQLVMLSIGRI